MPTCAVCISWTKQIPHILFSYQLESSERCDENEQIGINVLFSVYLCLCRCLYVCMYNVYHFQFKWIDGWLRWNENSVFLGAHMSIFSNTVSTIWHRDGRHDRICMIGVNETKQMIASLIFGVSFFDFYASNGLTKSQRRNRKKMLHWSLVQWNHYCQSRNIFRVIG